MKIEIVIIVFCFLLPFSAFTQRGELYKGEYYLPMPIPVKSENEIERINTNPISYNLRTGTENVGDVVPIDDVPIKIQPGQSFNFSQQNELDKRIFGALSLVADPSAYPYRVNVKLFADFTGGNYVCSGVLIDGAHVLTAGHCIYNHNAGGWANSVTVVPGYENGSEPFGSADGVSLHSWSGWTVNEDFNWDMGYVRLNRPVGGLTGWHGYGYNTNNAHYFSNNWINPGYPAESPYIGQYMYSWDGVFDAANTNLLWHNNLGYGGQSGSGTHINDNGSRYVHSVASHTAVDGNGNRIPPLYHNRMVEARFNNISSTIADHRPDIADLVAMTVYAEQNVVNTGDYLDSLVLSIFNYSEQNWTGQLNISFYLSTNTTISTADILLGTYNWPSYTIGSLNRFNGWISQGGLPQIPMNISDGTYYIGAIINNSDLDAVNNVTNDQDVFEIEVNKVFCAGETTFNGATRMFSDGSMSNGNYGNNSDCRWKINPFGADSITLSFSAFQLEAGYDSIHVYSDLNESNLVWSGSGFSIPSDLVVSGDEMVVHFTTDGSVTYNGFEATYTTNLPTYCQQGNVYNQMSGSFSDGSGDSSYVNYSYCTWLIRPDTNVHSITLVIDSLNIESNYDFLRVYGGLNEQASLLAEWSGTGSGMSVTTYGSELFVVFESDFSVTYPGWEAHYFSDTSYCQGHDTVVDFVGVLDDGSGLDNYHNYSDCSWLISPPGAEKVLLDFETFDIEDNYDFIYIHDGSTPYDSLIGVFSGDSIPGPVYSSGPNMLVRFVSDYSVTRTGWKAFFSGVYAGDCYPSDIILDNLSLPTGTYRTMTNIYSSSLIVSPDTVHLSGSIGVELLEGFQAEFGTTLYIDTEGCN